MPEPITGTAVLMALAVWGLLAFGYMGEERGTRSDGPLTLFGADGP